MGASLFGIENDYSTRLDYLRRVMFANKPPKHFVVTSKPESKNVFNPALPQQAAVEKKLDAASDEFTTDQMILSLDDIFMRVIEQNEIKNIGQNLATRFHSQTLSEMSILDYLTRLNKYLLKPFAEDTDCVDVLVYMTIILDEYVINVNPLTAFNCHRVIATSLLIAYKFWFDTHYNNAHFAKIAGMPCVELNRLELQLFDIMDLKKLNDDELKIHYKTKLHSNFKYLQASSMEEFVIVESESELDPELAVSDENEEAGLYSNLDESESELVKLETLSLSPRYI